MKPLYFSAAFLVLFAACRQKHVTASDPAAYSSPPPPATTTVTQTSTVTQQGDVTITTNDPSVSATIVINNPPEDSTVTTTVDGNNTSTTVDANTTMTTVDSSDIYRFTVQFISKGAGIDYKTQEAFETWLKEYPKHPAYEVTHWGREGEMNYCLKLKELSTREQEIFVRDARTMLSGKELVIVDEYAACKGTKTH